MYNHTIVIGDWSEDGHRQKDFFNFKCSHNETVIKKAYHDFVAKHNLGLHCSNKVDGHASVLNDYEDNLIQEDDYLLLVKAGVNFDSLDIHRDDCNERQARFTARAVAQLFMEMVKTEIFGFTYEEIAKPNALNGFWSKDFNYTFGYGTY